MKLWRRIAIGSVLGLLLLIGAAAAWLWTADLGVLKPRIERLVSEQYGREFRIAGRLNIDLGSELVVVAEDVRLENAEWADEPYLLQIGRLETRADFWSIFRGPVVVRLIDIDRVRIFLARPESGEPNWVGKPAADKEPTGEDGTSTGILVREVSIDDAAIVFESPERTGPIDLRIASFRQHYRDDDFLELGLDAAVGERRVSMTGEIGSWAALMSGQDIRYALAGQLDRFTFETSGHIDDLLEPARPSLMFKATGPDINDLFNLLGIDAHGEGDVNLAGSLQANGDEPLQLRIGGNIARLQIDAGGSFADLRNLNDFDVSLRASGPDLGRILRLLDIHQVPDAPFSIELKADRHGSSLQIERAHLLFAEAEFDLSATIPAFPDVGNADVELRVSGPRLERFRSILGLPGAATGEFSLVASLETSDDGVEIADMDLNTSLGRVDARGTLGRQPGLVGTSLQFSVDAPSLLALAGSYGLPRLPDVPVTISGNADLRQDGVHTRGPVVLQTHGITASVDGLIATVPGMTGSRIVFNLDGPDLSELVGAFAATLYAPALPYEVKGNLDVTAEGYRFRETAGTLGRSQLGLDGLLVPAGGLAGSRFSFSAGGPEMSELLTDASGVEVRPGRYAIAGNVSIQTSAITVDSVRLERDAGVVQLQLEIGSGAEEPRLRFKLDANGADVRTFLSRIEGVEASEAAFSAGVRGEWQNRRLDLDDLNVRIGDATVKASGELDLSAGGGASRLKLAASAPSLAALGSYGGHRMRDQSLTVDALVRGNSGDVSVDDLKIRLDNSDINGIVKYVAGDRPRLEIDLRSAALVLESPMQAPEEEYEAEPTFEDERLIPDTPLPLDALASLDASIALSLADLIRDGRHFRGVEMRLNLEDGDLTLSRFGFEAPSGRIDARASLKQDQGMAEVDLEVSASNFALGLADNNRDLSMTGELEINLHGAGNDLRSLAASSNGIVLLDTRGGKMTSNRYMQALYGDMLQEILSVINPFYKADPYTSFECIVLPLRFTNGTLVSEPNVVVLTDKLRIVSNASINLESEALDLGFRSTPRKGVVISAGEILNPFVKVVGTLAAPKLAVDEQGVLLSGGTAVATGGLSILARAAWDRLNRSSDPCGDISKQAHEALGGQFPDIPPPPAD